MDLRQLGTTNLYVSPVAMGCWPISGMTSLGVNEVNSLNTLRASVDAGINFFVSVPQLVVNWTINQPGITSALCGAKRAHQIEETAGAAGWQLDQQAIGRIGKALLRRGPTVSLGAV